MVSASHYYWQLWRPYHLCAAGHWTRLRVGGTHVNGNMKRRLGRAAPPRPFLRHLRESASWLCVCVCICIYPFLECLLLVFLLCKTRAKFLHYMCIIFQSLPVPSSFGRLMHKSLRYMCLSVSTNFPQCLHVSSEVTL